MPLTMQEAINSVFTSRQIQFHSTLKPITPFGGPVGLIEIFNTLKLGEVLGRLTRLRYSRPNAITPEKTFFALTISILAGAQRGYNPSRPRTEREAAGHWIDSP